MLEGTLTPLGWDLSWGAALAAHPDEPEALLTPGVQVAPQRLPARVCRADRDACDVLVAGPDDPTPVTAAWSGAVQRSYRNDPTTAPVTGDWVVVAPTPGGGLAVTYVLPRRSAVRSEERRGG